MSKKILILLGFLFLTIFFLGNISAVDVCWVEASSADCVNNNGKVVMSLSGATNAHGALAGQGTFIPVLCCNFGGGDTTCTSDNKIIGLSSSTNAHAEIPDLVSPNYNIDVCYDSLRNCRRTDVSCGINEIEVFYLSSGEAQLYTNAHIEEAGLQSQNYDSKICCVIELPMACSLTSAEWQYEEVMDGTDTGAIVNGTGCSGVEISFEVFRGSTSCDDIEGCENPVNMVFGAGSNSVSGTWSAGPYHDNEYRFVTTVVATGETVPSEPNLLVIAECPYDPEPVICSDYTTESHCNSNICEIDVEDSVPTSVDCGEPGINCECVWEDNECKASWEGTDSGYCGDGLIGIGEQCDGSNWGAITNCSNFDVFTGGSLTCRTEDCQFDTALCTGGPGGYCGDGDIGAGETCDGSNWGAITGCSNFDVFTGGDLSCVDCSFDTNLCTEGTMGICNDGDINTGETCDGSNWGPITNCSDFDDFTGGDLSCVDCSFDTNLCTGGTGGYCGDGVIDAGETCDGSDWGPITNCSDFDDFTGGTLICTDCQFDTSLCAGGIGPKVGICIYTQSTDDTCDDDEFLTFSWTTEWIWSGECDATCQSQPQNLALKTECDNDDGLTRSLACPAQIPLPFFNIYSFVAALTIIALIYVILILRKEKRKR